MQPSPHKNLRDFPLAEHWIEELQPSHEVVDEIGEAVDRLAELDESIRAVFIEPFVPGGNHGCGELEDVSGLLLRSRARGLEFEELKPSE